MMIHTIFNWWHYSLVDSLILITALLTLTNSKSIAPSKFTILDYLLLTSGSLFLGLKILAYFLWQKPIEKVPSLSDNSYFLGNTTLYFPNPKVHEVFLSNAEKYGDVYQVKVPSIY